MDKSIRIVYLEHSAFAAEYESTLLIFDYARGETPEDADIWHGWITRDLLEKYKKIIVFASHSHSDHYDKRIFEWRAHPGIEYVLGNDIVGAPEGRRISLGDTIAYDGLLVTAHASTDMGVSFMIDWKEAGYKLFHAGDLNLWHWRDESTLKEVEQAEQAFYEAMKPLKGSLPDVAFFPVDPRQGALYDAGATYFIAQAQPRLFIPMHWQGRADVVTDFARRAIERSTRVLPMTVPGATVLIARDDEGIPRASRAQGLASVSEVEREREADVQKEIQLAAKIETNETEV